jgi:predicted RNase H-like nuclease (RuvC/YqgF family)
MKLSPKIQSALLLLLTLAIGFAGGVLVSGQFYRQKVEKIRRFVRDQDRFAEHLLDQIQATEAQREALTPILTHHMETVRDLNRAHIQQMRGKMDSLRRELEEHLSPDQMKQLGRELRFFRLRKGGGRSHPPHGPPPGR